MIRLDLSTISKGIDPDDYRKLYNDYARMMKKYNDLIEERETLVKEITRLTALYKMYKILAGGKQHD